MADIRRERPPDATIAAHLLDIVDPRTGQAISNNILQPQIAQLFFAGFESAPSLTPNLALANAWMSIAVTSRWHQIVLLCQFVMALCFSQACKQLMGSIVSTG